MRFIFLDSRARTFYADWETSAHDIVAALRSEAGRNPYDRALSDLIGQLSTRSDEFRIRWASHDVQFHRSSPHRPPRTSGAMEELVLETRRALRDESVLGAYGAEAIARALALRVDLPGPLPAVRTIGRILERRLTRSQPPGAVSSS